MEKVVSPSFWSFDQPAVSLVKISQAGLVGNDLRTLIKLAGHSFADEISKIAVAKDEIPVHVIAIGATEYYGPNRNGDGFKEATCKEHHPSFVKFAKVYQHHKNKDPHKSYGTVKASAYNDAMHRIELFLTINGSKEAADRTNSLFDEELAEKAKANEDLGVSMACHIAYDVCSGCGNKAKSRAEYCESDTCKYGGCKHNLTKVAADGHILHVDNPNPKFFDISRVVRPADRIAYGGLADYFQKAASGEVLGGAALAELYGMNRPQFYWGEEARRANSVASQIKAAEALERAFYKISQNPQLLQLSKAFAPEVCDSISTEPLGKIAESQLPLLWKTLAQQKIALTIPDFLCAVVDCPREKAAAIGSKIAAVIPNTIKELVTSVALTDTLHNNPYLPSDKEPAYSWKKWAQEHTTNNKLALMDIRDRAMLSAVRGVQKIAHIKEQLAELPSAEIKELAKQYCLYKIAFLGSIADKVDVNEYAQSLVLQDLSI